jgi:hypothetical protein
MKESDFILAGAHCRLNRRFRRTAGYLNIPPARSRQNVCETMPSPQSLTATFGDGRWRTVLASPRIFCHWCLLDDTRLLAMGSAFTPVADRMKVYEMVQVAVEAGQFQGAADFIKKNANCGYKMPAGQTIKR